MKVSSAILELGVKEIEPLYIYDLERLRQRCRILEEIPVERKSIFFATMANDHPEILNCIQERGHGVFVNSPKHLRLALSQQFEPKRIIYAATNMLAEEMKLCLNQGVKLVLDSLNQIQLFAEIAAPGHEFGVRVNVGSALNKTEFFQDPSYRFGILPSELPVALDIAKAHKISIIGVHSYFGTDLMNPDILLNGIEKLGRIAEMLPDLKYIDAGGGFGVGDKHNGPEFDINYYGIKTAKIIKDIEHRLGKNIELFLEPGRYMTASCGFFFVKVVDIKIRSDRVFVGTNGSVAIFPRPLMNPNGAVHPCEIVGQENFNLPYNNPIYICGNSTYSQDFLAREISFPLPKLGDTILFYNAGAYCRSMITSFLGKDHPSEIVLH